MRTVLVSSLVVVLASLTLSAPARANCYCVGGYILIDGKWVWESCRFVRCDNR